ncbi:MAG: V-type ATPase 116kDa subunit family protein [bacterium]|nr:V-type ATPase 116kDa subunit family protein [bacterium]
MSVFRPEKMVRLAIYCMANKINEVTSFLIKSGMIQFSKEQVEVPKKNRELEEKVSKEKDRISTLVSRLLDVSAKLKVNFSKYDYLSTLPQPMSSLSSKKIEEHISELELLINPLVEEINTSDKKLDEFFEFRKIAMIFEKSDIQFGKLFNSTFFNTYLLKIKQENLHLLHRGLARIDYIKEGFDQGEFTYLILITLKENDSSVKKVIRGANAAEIKVPHHYLRWTENIKKLLESIELDIWTIKESDVESRLELIHLKKKYEERLFLWYVYLEFHLQISELKKNFAITEAGFLISGWIPEKNLSGLETTLKTYDENSSLISEVVEYTGQESETEQVNIEDIPVSLSGNKIFKPFTLLISNFGLPRYNEMDPTFIVAFTYLFMFGLMFGDIGHGGILLVSGIILLIIFRNSGEGMKHFAWILTFCGLSGVIFGFLFGSIFGNEEIIKPILFSPLHEMNLMMLLGLALGGILLSLGMVINIIQKFMMREPKEAIFGEWGVFSLLFYWNIGATSILIVTGNWNLQKNYIVISLIIGVPILAMVLKDLIWNLFFPKKQKIPVDAGEEGTEHDEGFVSSIFNLLIMVMDLFTNTLSFIRTSAFAMNHAAMSGAIFLVVRALSSLVKGPVGQEIVRWDILIFGTAGIILLEGMVVAIQALRLEYYEFFSKFFSGGGKPFVPVKPVSEEVMTINFEQ